jgi:hypothetical protein
MSIAVMTMIFKRYPRGGNEKLLALAIGDVARDDGTKIFPSVATLATMSSQSERGVQRLVRDMLGSGWLQLVRASTGRRGDCTEYRISPEWLAGGDPIPPDVVPDRRTVSKPTSDKLAPVSAATGDSLAPVAAVDNLKATGDSHGLSGDTQGLSGDTAVSPNPSLPVNNKNPPTPRSTGGDVEKTEQPNPGASAKERQRWRWAERRSEIEARGEQLGFGKWDEAKRGLGGELFVQYAARVFIAHLATVRRAGRAGEMLRALSANTNWSEVVRSMRTTETEARDMGGINIQLNVDIGGVLADLDELQARCS